MSTKHIIVISFIAIFGFALRIQGITFGLPTTTGTLATYHPDESIHLYSLEKMDPSKFNFYPGDALYWGSLHIYLQGALSKISSAAGLIRLGNRDFLLKHLAEADKLYIVGRIISVLAGTCAIFALYLLAIILTDKNTAIIAAFLWAVAPLPVVSSLYAKPDALFSLWYILSIYFSIRAYRSGKIQDFIAAGAISGLATASKYPGLLATCFLVLAYTARAIEHRNFRKDFTAAILGMVAAPLAFVLVNPYSVIRFADFSQYFHGMVFGKSAIPASYFSGLINYIVYNLSAAISVPLVFMSAFGLAVMLLLEFSPITAAIAVFALIYVLRFGPPDNQAVTYTMPLIPFLIIYAARGIRYITNTRTGIFIAVLSLLYVISYTVSYKSLFKRPDTREQASVWMTNNIPEKTAIGISRSDFFTPACIKNPADSKYTVLTGAKPSDPQYAGITGLGAIMDRCEYIVITDCEYQPVIKRPLSDPAQFKIIKTLFGPGWKEVAMFQKEIDLYGIPYYHKYLCVDWMIPDPKIIILKRSGLKDLL